MKTESTYGRNGYRNRHNNYNQQPSTSSSANSRKTIHASRQNYNPDQKISSVVLKPKKVISQPVQQISFPAAYNRHEYHVQVAPKQSPVKRGYVLIRCVWNQ